MEAKENLWYPGFNLQENPFRYFEAALEKELTEDYLLETPMLETVKGYLDARTNCIIIGPRGCGKSSLITFINEESPMAENRFCVVAPRSMANLMHDLYLEIIFNYRNEIINAILKIWGKTYSPSWLQKEEGQEMGRCIVCPSQCSIKIEIDHENYVKRYAPLFMSALQEKEGACKARDRVLLRLFDECSIQDTFLIDVPDNLSKEIMEFTDLVAHIIRGPWNNVILMATPEQVALLKRYDTFARLPVVEWENPPPTFFTSLFKNRIEIFTAEGAELRYPFTDELIAYLSKLADFNLREFLRICGMVLIQMRTLKVGRQWGIEDIRKDEIKVRKVFIIQEAIDEALAQVAPGSWIKVKQIKDYIKQQYQVDLSPETLGRILSRRKLPRRYNPDAEYLLTMQ